jgi:hypothetical protein
MSHAAFSMQLDAAHQKVTNGVISGVITTLDLQNAISAQAAELGGAFCSKTDPTLEALLMAVGQASDIMKDGNQDPLSTCNGISIGLGFEGSIVQLGGPFLPPILPKPCVSDGGTDGGEGSGSASSSGASGASGASSSSGAASTTSSSSGAGGSDGG